MAVPEQVFKAEIKRYLESIGAFWSVVQGGAFSKPGDPDMVVCHKGRYIAIEAKTASGTQSAIQKTRQRQIEASGGIYILARNMDDIKRVMENDKSD